MATLLGPPRKPIYSISGGAGFLWVASFDPIGRGIMRFATIDPSAIHPTPLPSEAQSSNPQSKPQDAEPPSAERANVGADVARRDVAIQEADKAIETTKTDTDVARE